MGRLGIIRQEMRNLRKQGLLWREIAVRYGVTVGMAWRICVEGYEPRERRIRDRLGLTRRRRQKLDELPVELLRRMIEEREEL